MNGRAKLMIIITTCIIIVFLVSQKLKIPVINKYLFLQQLEDTCHLCCWYNYNLLNNIRHKIGIINKSNLKHIKPMSKYHCYAIDSLLALSWHHQVVTMSPDNKNSDNYPLIKEFFRMCYNQGIIIPHIYIDNKQEINIFDHYGLKGLSLFYLLPGTFTNYNDIQKLNANIFGFKIKLNNIIEFPDSNLTFPYFITSENEKFIYNFRLEKFVEYTNINQICHYYGISNSDILFLGICNSNNIKCYKYLINVKVDNSITLYFPIETTHVKTYAWQVLNNNNGFGLQHYSNLLKSKHKIIIYGRS